eukprot:10763253-Alexandrium_andersonii.AAC.1
MRRDKWRGTRPLRAPRSESEPLPVRLLAGRHRAGALVDAVVAPLAEHGGGLQPPRRASWGGA